MTLSPERLVRNENHLRFLAGGLTGIMVKTLLAPVDRLKILFETQTMFLQQGTWNQSQLKYRGIPSAFRLVWQEEGVRGLFRGNLANIIRTAPNSAIKFGTFDLYKGYVQAKFHERFAMIHSIMAASLSGATEVLVTYPLDVTRTRMAMGGKYTGILDCIRRTYEGEGVRGFYKGLTATLLGVMPYVGVSMGIYDTCKHHLLSAQPNPLLKLLCGGIGSLTASCITFPTDVVRRRMQLQGSLYKPKALYKGTFDCARTIIRTEGVRGLYRGISLQLFRSIPATSLQLVTFDAVKSLFGLKDR